MDNLSTEDAEKLAEINYGLDRKETGNHYKQLADTMRENERLRAALKEAQYYINGDMWRSATEVITQALSIKDSD